MRRRLLATALLVLLSLPAPALGQGQVVDLLDGRVLIGQTGDTDDLEMSDREVQAAKRRVEDLSAGIVMLDPTLAGEEAARTEAIAQAAEARLATADMLADRCLVDADRSAADCIEQLFLDDALAILVVGDFGDLVDATEVPLRNRTIVVGVGESTLAEGAVRMRLNPVKAAREQGLVGGRSLGVTPPKRRGAAMVLGARDPEQQDAVREATEAGIRSASRRIRIRDRLGPTAVHTPAELGALLADRQEPRLVTGPGLLLDGLDPADPTALDGLPERLRMVAWTCTPGVEAHLDVASRLRGCVTLDDAITGDAAASVILAIKTSRDVPETIELPAFVNRGTAVAGPGLVALGRRSNRETPVVSDADRAAAATILDGRIVGIVVPVQPGGREGEEQRLIRTELEAAITELGASPQVCVGKGAAARRCIDDLVSFGAAAVMPIATGTDLAIPATKALEAGVIVIGINEGSVGDAGAVNVRVNPWTVGRLSGRMAGAYADRVWKGQPVEVVVFNDEGAGGDDTVASAVERSIVQTASDVSVVARLASRDKAQQQAAVRRMLKRHPGVRMIVGKNAAAAAPILIRRDTVSPELTIYAQECTPDIVAAIDAGVGTGGRLKGCVDRNPTGAGRLAGEALVRLASGGTVPETIEVPVLPYEP